MLFHVCQHIYDHEKQKEKCCFGVFQSKPFIRHCQYETVCSAGCFFFSQRSQFFGVFGQGEPAPNDISTDTNISGVIGYSLIFHSFIFAHNK